MVRIDDQLLFCITNNIAMPIQIDLLDAAQTVAYADQLREVYLEAFAAPPYGRDAQAAQEFAADTLPRHAQRHDFRCVVARTAPNTAIVGFAYGYTGTAGQWWTDAVAGQMPPPLATRWLPNHFELVELAVAPALHGNGIGGQLHDRLLVGLPHQRALLSTAQTWTPARALYEKRGWRLLLSRFFFPGSIRPYVVMGKELHH